MPLVSDGAPKKPWQSKTMILGVIGALLPLVFPPAAVWIAANPELYGAISSGAFMLLRVVTDGKISFTD